MRQFSSALGVIPAFGFTIIEGIARAAIRGSPWTEPRSDPQTERMIQQGLKSAVTGGPPPGGTTHSDADGGLIGEGTCGRLNCGFRC